MRVGKRRLVRRGRVGAGTVTAYFVDNGRLGVPPREAAALLRSQRAPLRRKTPDVKLRLRWGRHERIQKSGVGREQQGLHAEITGRECQICQPLARDRVPQRHEIRLRRIGLAVQRQALRPAADRDQATFGGNRVRHTDAMAQRVQQPAVSDPFDIGSLVARTVWTALGCGADERTVSHHDVAGSAGQHRLRIEPAIEQLHLQFRRGREPQGRQVIVAVILAVVGSRQ